MLKSSYTEIIFDGEQTQIIDARCFPQCWGLSHPCGGTMLEEARKLTSSREILLWMTPSEAPKALQASECSVLLDPVRASCWMSAQH